MHTPFPQLRPFQSEALHAFTHHPHTVLISPTGSGKSLVFQKYLYDSKSYSRALVVSPLNALARQLAQGLKDLGLNVNLGVGRAGLGPPEGSGIWIVSPEKLMGSGLARAEAWRPNCLIVDEAHCVWEWGERFRPEFAKIPTLVKRLKIQKSFWCSATLPPDAFLKIAKELESHPLKIGRFSLPSALRLERTRIASHRKLAYLRQSLENHKNENGMIFVSTRSAAERLQAHLSAWGLRSLFYHAGMSSEERIAIETRLAQSDPVTPMWIVATSAFGMGMNYSFLKCCIVFDPCLSLLALAQAVGRVGRSSALANAEVIWHEDDFIGLRSRMVDSDSIQRLGEVQGWCASPESPSRLLEKYFNQD